MSRTEVEDVHLVTLVADAVN